MIAAGLAALVLVVVLLLLVGTEEGAPDVTEIDRTAMSLGGLARGA